MKFKLFCIKKKLDWERISKMKIILNRINSLFTVNL